MESETFENQGHGDEGKPCQRFATVANHRRARAGKRPPHRFAQTGHARALCHHKKAQEKPTLLAEASFSRHHFHRKNR